MRNRFAYRQETLSTLAARDISNALMRESDSSSWCRTQPGDKSDEKMDGMATSGAAMSLRTADGISSRER